MRAGGTPPRLGNMDPNSTRLAVIGFFPHTMSTTDSSSDGMITSPMMKSSGTPGSLRLYLLSANDGIGLFGHVATLANDVPANVIFSGFIENVKMVRVHLSTGDVLQVDLPPVTDALELARDRSFWRQIATARCYG